MQSGAVSCPRGAEKISGHVPANLGQGGISQQCHRLCAQPLSGLEQFLDSGANGAFVFEDDAKPIDSRKAQIKGQLGRLWANAAQFDIVFLANRQIQSKNIVFAGTALDLCCLKYSGVGARAISSPDRRPSVCCATPCALALEVDTLMHHWWLNGSKVLYLTQPLFEEDGRQTSIGYEGAEKARGGNLFLGLLRRVNRLRWSIYKRLKFPSYLRAMSRLVM